MHQRHTLGNRWNQAGMALAVALLLLTLLTVLALSASQTTKLEEHMSGNARDIDIAFQAAEAGARAAEDYLASLPLAPVSPCTSVPCKIYQPGFLPADLAAASGAWWTAYGWDVGASTKLIPAAIADPKYVIEEIAFIPDSTSTQPPPTGRHFFRIVSLGNGATDAARAIVETTYVRRLDSSPAVATSDNGRQSWRQIR